MHSNNSLDINSVKLERSKSIKFKRYKENLESEIIKVNSITNPQELNKISAKNKNIKREISKIHIEEKVIRNNINTERRVAGFGNSLEY
jgi:hypothetical protein